MNNFPPKLTANDEIRIIAPAMSLSIISRENIAHATRMLESLGLKVTFGENVRDSDMFHSGSVEARISDLHNAFIDKNVKAILTVIGGYNSNQLLDYINYDLIKENPKIFCGYSNITILQNAIYQKTNLVTYSGPHFSSFAMKQGFDYSLEYFKKMFFASDIIDVKPSEEWSDDIWFNNQDDRKFHKNDGYHIINQGSAEGVIIGGTLSSFQQLQGTEYMPSLRDKIVFLEGVHNGSMHDVLIFDRGLQSLIQQADFDKVKAIIFGRFEKDFGMDMKKLEYIIRTKKELNNIPIIANADFGHTYPIFTWPIGGTCQIDVKENSAKLKILNF